jgi:enhancer of polycomb-like protein
VACRQVRCGRGGVLRVDRRTTTRHPALSDKLLRYPRRLMSTTTVDWEMSSELKTDKEMLWRTRDRWLFDADNEPSVGPNGPDEKDRVLGDEFHPKYVLYKITLV